MITEIICAHGVIIKVGRHVDLAALAPMMWLGQAAMRLLEAGPAMEN